MSLETTIKIFDKQINDEWDGSVLKENLTFDEFENVAKEFTDNQRHLDILAYKFGFFGYEEKKTKEISILCECSMNLVSQVARDFVRKTRKHFIYYPYGKLNETITWQERYIRRRIKNKKDNYTEKDAIAEKKYGDKLKNIREFNRLSISKLSSLSKVPKKGIEQIENNEIVPSYKTLLKLNKPLNNGAEFIISDQPYHPEFRRTLYYPLPSAEEETDYQISCFIRKSLDELTPAERKKVKSYIQRIIKQRKV